MVEVGKSYGNAVRYGIYNYLIIYSWNTVYLVKLVPSQFLHVHSSGLIRGIDSLCMYFNGDGVVTESLGKFTNVLEESLSYFMVINWNFYLHLTKTKNIWLLFSVSFC